MESLETAPAHFASGVRVTEKAPESGDELTGVDWVINEQPRFSIYNHILRAAITAAKTWLRRVHGFEIDKSKTFLPTRHGERITDPIELEEQFVRHRAQKKHRIAHTAIAGQARDVFAIVARTREDQLRIRKITRNLRPHSEQFIMAFLSFGWMQPAYQ